MAARHMQDARAGFIGTEAARELCLALISQYQTEQIRRGTMSRDVHVRKLCAGLDVGQVDAITVTEDMLGIDSLALLDLVAGVTRYFGLDATGIEDYLLVQQSLGEWSALVAHHFERVADAGQITFSTSGSSGPPKHVPQTCAHLEAEVAGIAHVIFGGKPCGTRIVSAVAPHHIYGFLWSVLLPPAMGRHPAYAHESSLTRLVREAEAGDIVLATPFLWEKMADAGLSFAHGVIGVTSGGPTTAKTWRAAEQVGLESMLEVYGSSETGGVGYRWDMAEPLTLMHHLAREQDGIHRLWDHSALELQDKLVWGEGRAFAVAGRLDNVVQVAGTNVNLDLVQDALMQTGIASEAAVRMDGDRLKAFVVPKDNGDLTEAEARLRKALLTLPPVARPHRFAFGPRLPRNGIGKLSDWDAA